MKLNSYSYLEITVDDIIGKKFGLIEITEFVKRERHPKHNCYKHFYIGRCECGNEKEYLRQNIITGHTKSCGCLKKRLGSANPTFTGSGELGGGHWAQIKRHAIGRDLAFEITPDDAWTVFQNQDGQCALSGLPIYLNLGRNQTTKSTIKTASLDRIDSTKGYVSGNIQWVHKDINKMKMDLTTERFKELCKLVAQGGRTG